MSAPCLTTETFLMAWPSLGQQVELVVRQIIEVQKSNANSTAVNACPLKATGGLALYSIKTISFLTLTNINIKNLLPVANSL